MRDLALAAWGWGLVACADVTPPAAFGSGERTLSLLHTSDLHSRVWPYRERISELEASLGLGPAGTLQELGGFARLAFVVERERARGAGLWLDSGDALEGAEVFERFGGRLELELLGALGLSAMALGNHELSLAGPELGGLLTGLVFPVLASNLIPETASPLLGRISQSVLLDIGGVKIGVVGVANPSSPPHLAEPHNPWGLLGAADPAPATQAAIDDFGPRAGLIVVLSHLGLDGDRELVRATSGIDLVLGGHQHLVTREAEWQDDCAAAVSAERRCSPRRVPIVHSGAYGKLVSRLELTLAQARNGHAGWEIANLDVQQLALGAGTPERADVLERLQALKAPPQPPLAFLPEALSRRSALGGDSALGNLTADALREAASADVAVLNSSALRTDLEPGILLASDVVSSLPFAEPSHALWLSGRELKRGLERAGRRSAARRCESVLQIAGLRLRIECAACSGRGPCVEVSRRTPLGESLLRDDELLLLTLPGYLLLPGADFEALGGPSAAGASLAQALTRRVARLATNRAGQVACARALRELSPTRCAEAFGDGRCPLDAAHVRAACAGLPWLVGERDERIQMLP